ncbi:MAG TPA: trypsin-like peptidase domain-containing protein [Acidimicrobiia bacterium]|nr:trypsin-like peptidase domain-containing protein [Acidimicrobiia bacterium]
MTDTGPSGPQLWEPPSETPVGYEDTPASPPPTAKTKIDAWTIVIGLLGGVLLGTGVTLAVLGFTGVFEEPTPPTIPPPPTITLPPPTTAPAVVVEVGNATEVAQRAIPSSVAVETGSALGDGGGSGVVYSSDGYIITNHHVVDGATEVVVVFADGGRWEAEVIGSDPLTDIAVLRIGRGDLTPIDIGSSAGLTIGERAIAVGNPLALEGGPSVTSGIVSALDRSLTVETGTELYGLIQTDAPITRGSSGGALLDISARLIGITTAIAVSDVGAEGLGFAIPIDMAIGVANDLIESGEVTHGVLGIQGETFHVEQGGAEYPVGVLVTDVSTGSAYELGGGQVNDVITAIDGVPITTMEALLTEMRTKRSGDEVTVAVSRSDSDVDLTISLGTLE